MREVGQEQLTLWIGFVAVVDVVYYQQLISLSAVLQPHSILLKHHRSSIAGVFGCCCWSQKSPTVVFVVSAVIFASFAEVDAVGGVDLKKPVYSQPQPM